MADARDRAEWTEEDSGLYQVLAPVAVPARAEQLAALLTLLPFDRGDAFRAVELGCGTGALSYALLDCFPRAETIALDGSAAMRDRAAASLRPFGARARVEPFDLRATAWLARVEDAGCVLASLCLHHLDDEEKRAAFAAVAGRLAPGGALLIADLVAPRRPGARELFAATWDRAAEAQSLAETGAPDLFARFVEAEWNYYRFPDPFDRPSPLFEQLTWLREAGFADVDCFWLRAGHAIYGGYRSPAGDPVRPAPFADALRSAEAALRATAGPA